MSILGAIIVPHPPLIIPTVGRGREREVQAAIDAYRAAAKQAAAWEPGRWASGSRPWIMALFCLCG